MARAKRAKAASANGGGDIEDLNEDAKGNPYLPDTSFKPKAVKPLIEAVKSWKGAIAARQQAQGAEGDAKAMLSSLCQKYKDHFSTDPETGKQVYSAGGVKITITHKDEDQISAELTAPDMQADL